MFKVILMALQALQLVKPQDRCGEESNKESKVSIGNILLLVFMFPIIGAFLPWTRESVREGLELILLIPDWFSLIIVLIVVSIIGLRKYISEIVSQMMNRPRK